MSSEIELGEDRGFAKERHIIKSLGTSDCVTTDMIQIFPMFDKILSLKNPNTPRREIMAELEENLSRAERLISKWDTNTTNKMLFQNSPEVIRMYMHTVHNLHLVMEHLSRDASTTADLIRAQRLMMSSMSRLEKEFHTILLSHNEAIDPDRWSLSRPSSPWSTEDSVTSYTGRSSDDDGSSSSSSSRPSTDRILEFEMVPLDAVVDLRNIAQCMTKSGYGGECVRTFALARKSIVEESLYNLGVNDVRLNDVRKMEWRLLDKNIKKWIYAAKISIRIVFAREKRLCDEVFEGLDKMGDYCFAEIAKDSTARLLAFAEAVATNSRGPERIFRVLDLYETLTDLMPDIEATYCQDLCGSVQEQANEVLVLLGETAIGVLAEFENVVKKEKSKATIAGGTIHPLTRYVMNYLTFLSDYKETLINLKIYTAVELPIVLPDDFAVDDPSNPLSIRLGWNVFRLVCKLEAKSDLYKDVAASYLFLMNNLHYIVKKVRGSDLKFLLGEQWLRKRSNTVRQFVANYERAAWTEVLSSLTEEGIPVNLKDRLEGFNLAMEEVTRRHSGWVVPDLRLREMVGHSISQKLIPAYTSFLARFKTRFESEMYIKYKPGALHDFVVNRLKGRPSNMTSP